MPSKARIPTCHPDRPHKAKGLCASCYVNAWQRKHPEVKQRFLKKLRGAKAERILAWHAVRAPKDPALRVIWVKKHKEELRQRQNRRRAANAENYRRRAKAWRQDNPERVRLGKQGEYERHADKIKERVRLWKKSHPDRVREHNERRRARKAGSAVVASDIERQWRYVLFAGLCAYCADTATSLDHVLALSKGGKDCAGNLVPACRRCNSCKGTQEWRGWFRSTKWHDLQRERFIEKNTWQK